MSFVRTRITSWCHSTLYDTDMCEKEIDLYKMNVIGLQLLQPELFRSAFRKWLRLTPHINASS